VTATLALADAAFLADSARHALSYLESVGNLYESDGTVIRCGLAVDATTAEVALALGMLARCRRDFAGAVGGMLTLRIAAGLLRTADRLADAWPAVCDAADEQHELRTDPDSVDRWADDVTDRDGWWRGRIAELDDVIEAIAWKAVAR
jgi:hypothetical protein